MLNLLCEWEKMNKIQISYLSTPVLLRRVKKYYIYNLQYILTYLFINNIYPQIISQNHCLI